MRNNFSAFVMAFALVILSGTVISQGAAAVNGIELNLTAGCDAAGIAVSDGTTL